jgi:hypothetical protein
MRMKILLNLLAFGVLCLAPTPAAAQADGILIPYSDDGSIDGGADETKIDWSQAVDLPLEALPLRTQALHDGEALYFAFEVVEPKESWETFTVFDSGDNILYNEGDVMVLCNQEGCQRCQYEGLYDYVCLEDLVSAVVNETIEVEIPLSSINLEHIVMGVILDGSEHVSDKMRFILGEKPKASETEVPTARVTEATPVLSTQAPPTPPSEVPHASLWLIPVIVGIILALIIGIVVFRKSQESS